MIEIGFGVLTILGALAILMGAGDTLRLPVGDIYPLIGFGGVAMIAALGLALVWHGHHRHVLLRGVADRAGHRVRGLAFSALAVIAIGSLVLPLMAELLDLVRVGGFPLGFYMTAQGALVGLVALAFAHVLRHDAIDREEAGDE